MRTFLLPSRPDDGRQLPVADPYFQHGRGHRERKHLFMKDILQRFAAFLEKFRETHLAGNKAEQLPLDRYN